MEKIMLFTGVLDGTLFSRGLWDDPRVRALKRDYNLCLSRGSFSGPPARKFSTTQDGLHVSKLRWTNCPPKERETLSSQATSRVALSTSCNKARLLVRVANLDSPPATREQSPCCAQPVPARSLFW